MNKKFAHRYLLPALGCGLVIIGLLYYYFMSDLSASDKTQYVCIDRDDNVDSVFAKLTPISNAHALTGYKTLVRHTSYADHVRTGRYAIEPGTTDIEENAFYRCNNLSAVLFPEELQRIGTRAFMDCSRLEKADLPSSAAIEPFAFQGTQIALS